MAIALIWDKASEHSSKRAHRGAESVRSGLELGLTADVGDVASSGPSRRPIVGRCQTIASLGSQPAGKTLTQFQLQTSAS